MPEVPETLYDPAFWETGITAVIIYGLLGLWGLIDCFYGFRVFKATLALMGTVLGLVGGALLGWELGGTGVWAIVGCIIGMVTGGFLAYAFYLAGLFSFGFWLGLIFGSLFTGLVPAEYAEYLTLAIACISGIAMMLVAKPFIVVGTAITGAFRVTAALAYLALGTNLLVTLRPDAPPPNLLAPDWLPVTIGTGILAVLGGWYQFRQNRTRRARKSEDD